MKGSGSTKGRVTETQLADVAQLLMAAGWRDTCDAQWAGLEKALPELKKALEAKQCLNASPPKEAT